MSIKHLTVRDAQAELAGGGTYIDVRSIPEFAQGHPRGAINVPLLHHDERTGQMAPNGDFVAVMQANFAAESKLFIGCQVGGRSVQAAQILAGAGYKDIANVLGGFGGARDPITGGTTEGWIQAGLPVEGEATPGDSYRALLAKTGQVRA
jgi:rhodanese-related sulfurtransferase